MWVYGADFSGAMNPKIFYAYGELVDSHLTLKDYVFCDDRLDLYTTITRSTRGIWGLDFPFSLPRGASPALGYGYREQMLNAIAQMTRKEFAKFIDTELQDYTRKCVDEDRIYCRHTDVAVQAHSAFKTVNPNLRVMTYSGLKLVLYLSQLHVNVYPFGNQEREYDETFPSVYEVYPSYAWQSVGLKRSTDVDKFIERFNALGHITVSSEIDHDTIKSQDLADSIVACVMMATAYITQEMHRGWDYRLPIFTDDEWGWRYIEGLIVRF